MFKKGDIIFSIYDPEEENILITQSNSKGCSLLFSDGSGGFWENDTLKQGFKLKKRSFERKSHLLTTIFK
jgi:hypothetical protein